MKISEMTNDQATEALIRMSGPIGRLCDDEDIVSILDDFSKMRDIGITRAIGQMLPRVVTYALQKHKTDLYEIVGALGCVPSAEVAGMPFSKTIEILQTSYDDILKDFFTRSVTAAKTNEE